MTGATMVSGGRTQWAVGQGFFHSGYVTVDRTTVSYIYDCGAQKKYAGALMREIDAFTMSSHSHVNTDVDVLYLSHFDYDHVSGLQKLLSTVKVHHVVIPMVSAAERVMVLARQIADSPQLNAPPVWYAQLIAAPSEWFERHGALVTEVRPEDGDVPEPPPWIFLNGESQADWTPPPRGGVSAGLAAAMLGRRRDGEKWVWAPWVLPSVHQLDAAFIHEVDRLRPPGRYARWTSSTDDLIALITDRHDILATAYLNVAPGSDRNFTSLCLYSGPVAATHPWHLHSNSVDRSIPTARGHVGCVGPFAISSVGHMRSDAVGWLATGDAPLKAQSRARQFLRAFAGLTAEVGTFCLPHHGSASSFNPGLFDNFLHPVASVVSADKYSNWQHPGIAPAVAATVRGHLVWVTSDPTTRWFEAFRSV